MLPIIAALGMAAAAQAASPDLAARLERRADHAEARYHLGMLYNNGIGVAKDPRRAFALFRKAAEAGDPLALSSVRHAMASNISSRRRPIETLAGSYRARAPGKPGRA